jgi:hypothetical protein
VLLRFLVQYVLLQAGVGIGYWATGSFNGLALDRYIVVGLGLVAF